LSLSGAFFSGDFFARALIILGVVVLLFGNFKSVMKNRKINHKRKLVKYYNNYYIQHLPLYSNYILSALIGVGIWRVGSFLKLVNDGNHSLSILNVLLMDTEAVLANQTLFISISLLSGILFVFFCMLLNVSLITLGKNISSFVDVKDGNYLTETGLYGIVRHPAYLSEILIGIFASFALFSWAIFLWVIFVHMPLLIIRAKKEDELLEHYYGKNFTE